MDCLDLNSGVLPGEISLHKKQEHQPFRELHRHIRPIAKWILDEDILDDTAFQRFRKASEDLSDDPLDFEKQLIAIAYDSIGAHKRQNAREIARGEMGAGEDEFMHEIGFVQRMKGEMAMPPMVRKRMKRRDVSVG